MIFVIDAQLPPSLCRWLSAHGHDAVHVAEIRLLAASDRAIADETERRGAILISKDDDFLRLRRPDRFPLLWIRCGNVTNAGLTAWLDHQWPGVEALLAAGERLIELR